MTASMLGLALLTAAVVAAPAAAAQSGGQIPPQFRGQWAETPRACRPGPHQFVITVDTDGWSAPVEQNGRVTAIGPVRGDTHSFNVHDWAGPSETDGVMTLRRAGSRLIMTLSVTGGSPVRHDMVRCR